MLSLEEKFVFNQLYNIIINYTPIMLRYATVKTNHLNHRFKQFIYTVEPVHNNPFKDMNRFGLLVYWTVKDHEGPIVQIYGPDYRAPCSAVCSDQTEWIVFE